MKKILSLLLAIISLTVIICSCGQSVKPVETQTDSNGEIITTTTTTKQTTSKGTDKETTSTKNGIETTRKNDKFEFPEDHYIKTGYPLDNIYIETPTRVIMPTGNFTYYNKLDDEIYFLCFDPLCDHTKETCPVFVFSDTHSIVYSPYTKRLYLVRADTLFSMNFDGSDIKLEISFGEVGADITKPIMRQAESGRIESLQQYDNYLYFINLTVANNLANGGYDAVWSLFRYDLKTKKVENLSEQAGHNSSYFNRYILTDDKIYFYDLADEKGVRLFSANLDMTDIKEVDTINITASEEIYDGKNFYMINEEYKNGETSSVLPTVESYQIVCFNPETETITEVSEKSYSSGQNGAGMMTLYAVTDEYIYYTVADPFYIGTKHTKSGDRAVYNYRHTIYRMNKDGSDKKVVFEGLTSKDPKVTSYEINELYILEGGKKAIALVSADQYSTPIIMPNGYESANWQHSFYASFDIDDNGNFVNMHELVLDE